MDKTTSSQKGSEIFGSDWKFELRKILEEKINNPFLAECSYIIPFGSVYDGGVKFRRIGNKNPDTREFERVFGSAPKASNDPQTRYSSFIKYKDVDFMKLFVKRVNFDNTIMGLRLSFDATIDSGTFVDFKPQYKYLWDTRRRRVTVSYNFGSLNSDLVEKQAIALLNECNQVYLIYSQEGKNFIKNMV